MILEGIVQFSMMKFAADEIQDHQESQVMMDTTRHRNGDVTLHVKKIKIVDFDSWEPT